MKTPHIDRIAHEGARFVNAFHTTPLCSPNRASILTGQYASRHGIIDNVGRDAMSHRLPNYHLELRRLGYETAHIGKWHMGNDASPRPGYDHWVAFRGQGKIVDPVLWEDGEERKVEGYVTDFLSERAVDYVERKTRKAFRAISRAQGGAPGRAAEAGRHHRRRDDGGLRAAASPPRALQGRTLSAAAERAAARGGAQAEARVARGVRAAQRSGEPPVPRGAARRVAGGDPRARGDDGLGGRGRGCDPALARGNRPARAHLHRVPRRQRLFLRRARAGRRAPLSLRRRHPHRVLHAPARNASRPGARSPR